MTKEFKILDRNKVEIPSGGVVKVEILGEVYYQVLVLVADRWYLRNVHNFKGTLLRLDNFNILVEYKIDDIDTVTLLDYEFTGNLTGKVNDKVIEL